MEPAADLVCCPVCDALHRLDEVEDGTRARCIRCNTVLGVGQPEAILRVVVLATTSIILMGVVIFFPFLQLQQGVFISKASVFDTVMSFSEGDMVPLSIAVAFFVIVLPVTRLVLLIWALLPLSLERAPFRGAHWAMRWSDRLRPWAMAEIFMVGVAVALVKLADLATLSMGPAFWSLALIVIITALGDTQLSKHSIWTALDKASSAR